MAQRRRAGGAGALARRLGLRSTRAVALACLALVATFGGWGYLSARAGSGVTIERAGAASPVAETGQDVGSPQAAAGGDGADDGESATDVEAQDAARVLVHVDGAVASPGVYALLMEDPRVEDAVEAAGGLAEGADTTTLNLAAPVADGTKVHVPAEGEAAQAAPGEAASAAGTAAAPGSGGLVNINTADAAALQTLPGVGEATASAIIQDREQNGPFSSTEDLMRVSGIGEKKFAKVRDLICV